jgi:hypothetical protein
MTFVAIVFCNGNNSHKFIFLRSVLKMIKKRSKNSPKFITFVAKQNTMVRDSKKGEENYRKRTKLIRKNAQVAK